MNKKSVKMLVLSIIHQL